MPDIGRHCLANTALVLLSNYLTTCQLSAGCSVADNPGLWLESDPAVRCVCHAPAAYYRQQVLRSAERMHVEDAPRMADGIKPLLWLCCQ